jgi:thioesterase domain-containing protein
VEIVSLQDGNDKTPLYCMPTVSGSVSAYIELAKIVGQDRPVYGIRTVHRAQTGSLELFASLQDMADCIAGKLAEFHSYGPIYLIGYSFGGHLAIEVARQLVERRKAVPLVAIIDKAPSRSCVSFSFRAFHFLRYVGPWVLRIMIRLVNDPKHRVSYRDIALLKLRGRRRVESESWYKEMPKRRKEYLDLSLANARKYRFVGKYNGKMLLFRQKPSPATTKHPLKPWGRHDDYGWHRTTGADVQVIYLTGDHASCIQHPDVVDLASDLRTAMNDWDGLVGLTIPETLLATADEVIK